jgi:hypothetical protein
MKSCASWMRCQRGAPDSPQPWSHFEGTEGSGVYAPGLAGGLWRDWLEQLPGGLDGGAGREICHTSFQTTGRRIFELPGPAGFPVVVKCYPAEDPAPRFDPGAPKAGLSPLQAFHRNVELWRRGLAVPEPLAFLQADPDLCGIAWITITRLIEGCQPLMEFAFEHCCRHPPPRSPAGDWVEAALTPVMALHEAGFVHGDLHHHNVLIQPSGTPGRFRAFLTDFDLCRPARGTAPCRAQLVDLARLAASLYQVVPDWLLAHGLACYLRRYGLRDRRRARCRIEVATAYRRVLDRYLACFAQVEARSLAEAERNLIQAEVLP